MSVSLGGLIKDLRLQKQLSQLEISLALGWKESSRLSRIEQGKFKRPSRLLLDKLIAKMQLSEDERHRLYLAGNYLPTQSDIATARAKLVPLVDKWPYPATSLDFSWRIIHTNQHLFNLYRIPPTLQHHIATSLPNLIEIIFTPELHVANHYEKKEFIRLLAHFQHAHQSHTKEKWYLNLIQTMMNNNVFKELWPQAHLYTHKGYDIKNFAMKSINGQDYYCVMMSILNDPRFLVEYYFPASISTHHIYLPQIPIA